MVASRLVSRSRWNRDLSLWLEGNRTNLSSSIYDFTVVFDPIVFHTLCKSWFDGWVVRFYEMAIHELDDKGRLSWKGGELSGITLEVCMIDETYRLSASPTRRFCASWVCHQPLWYEYVVGKGAEIGEGNWEWMRERKGREQGRGIVEIGCGVDECLDQRTGLQVLQPHIMHIQTCNM